MSSVYFLFELGARWATHRPLLPLLAGGTAQDLLRGPLSALNALSCENEAQLYQFIGDLATALQRPSESPAVYHKCVMEVVDAAKTETPGTIEPARRSGEALRSSTGVVSSIPEKPKAIDQPLVAEVKRREVFISNAPLPSDMEKDSAEWSRGLDLMLLVRVINSGPPNVAMDFSLFSSTEVKTPLKTVNGGMGRIQFREIPIGPEHQVIDANKKPIAVFDGQYLFI
jgi:hypothetical protein